MQSPLLNRYYYPDALGSTAYLAGSGGGLLEGYSYDLYGTPKFFDAAGVERTGGTAYNVTQLYTGQQWHSATGLYDNRNRFLSPSLGRFLQPDPIGFAGDAANLYRYGGNNPVNASDPLGLWTFEAGLSFTLQLGPLTANYNGGFVFDGYGNIGLYNTVLAGGGAGSRVSGGVSFAGSNGSTIFDLKDQFLNASAGGYGGGGASVEGFNGRGEHGQIVVGGGTTIGVGLGGGGSVGVSQTWITPLYQPSPASGLQSVVSAPIDPSIPVYEHITVTGKPVPEPAPAAGGNLVPLRGPSGRIVQAPANFGLWLSAFPEGLLSHLLADSPTAQALGVGSYAPSGNRIPNGSGELGPPPPNLSAAYQNALRNP